MVTVKSVTKATNRSKPGERATKGRSTGDQTIGKGLFRRIIARFQGIFPLLVVIYGAYTSGHQQRSEKPAMTAMYSLFVFNDLAHFWLVASCDENTSIFSSCGKVYRFYIQSVSLGKSMAYKIFHFLSEPRIFRHNVATIRVFSNIVANDKRPSGFYPPDFFPFGVRSFTPFGV